MAEYCDLLIEWNKNPGMYCNKFWSGWDKILTDEIKAKYNIVDIGKFIILCYNMIIYSNNYKFN